MPPRLKPAGFLALERSGALLAQRGLDAVDAGDQVEYPGDDARVVLPGFVEGPADVGEAGDGDDRFQFEFGLPTAGATTLSFCQDMHHTFQANSCEYWSRVALVVGPIFAFGLLPLIAPASSDPGGFVFIVNAIGVVSLGVMAYARPRELTLVIDERGVLITDRSQRVIISKALSEVVEVSMVRWGHILNFSIGWIVLRESGRAKPHYFGAISGYRLHTDAIASVRKSFLESKRRDKLCEATGESVPS